MDNHIPSLKLSSSSSSMSNMITSSQPHDHHQQQQLLQNLDNHHHHQNNEQYVGFMATDENINGGINSSKSTSGTVEGSCPVPENEAKGEKKKDQKKAKKPRIAFQTRSRVDILDDGYRWRKYGQKAVKNNRFPRSYYRCTQQECNVKKQVQRLSKDEEIVVTTYEGVHSHPIHKSTDNFDHILTQMQIYTSS